MSESKTPGESRRRAAPSGRGFALLGLALLVGLVHALLYVFLVPPWQHYDEPAHFEHVWLVADRSALPEPGDQDPAMRRDLAISMIENGFYRGLEFAQPDPDHLPQRFLGMTYLQLEEPPLYYLFAAFPVRALLSQSVEIQMIGARLASLLLFLVTIVAGWGIVYETTSPGSPLRWLVPFTMALLPGFVDLMTAVNNDVAAIAVFSLFLWGSASLVRRGFSWIDLVWVLLEAGLSVLAKSTVYLVLPLLPVVLLLSIVRGRGRRWVWAVLGVAGLVMVGIIISWGDAAYWFRSSAQESPTRLARPQAPAGDHALILDTVAQVTPRWLRPLNQALPLSTIQRIRGGEVTLGAYIWVDELPPGVETVPMRSPVLRSENDDFWERIAVSEIPEFYAFTVDLPEDIYRLWISLEPRVGDADVRVVYDGFVLAEGVYPVSEKPLFADDQGTQGTWGGRPFTNLLRNPSGEKAWPMVRQWADSLAAQVLPDDTRLSMILSSFLDWQGAGWYYYLTAQNLVRTFWAKFGWGHVPLQIGAKPYRVLALITAFGIIGGVAYLWEKRRSQPWHLLGLFGLVLLGIWGGALIRGVIYIFVPNLFVPGARYAYPAIVPTLLVLAASWLYILRALVRMARISQKWAYGIYFAGFLALDTLSLWSIIVFYRLIS